MQSQHWKRREVLAGMGLALLGGGVVAETLMAQSSASSSNTKKGRKVIRTILKDIDPGIVKGSALMHEHLGAGHRRIGPDGKPIPGPAPDPTEDAAWMTVELKAAKAAGIDLMVSTQANMPGQDVVSYLTKLSQDCGMHLVCSAAYYNKANYPKQLSTQSEDEIAEGLVQAATAARMGALGEFGVANGEAEMDPVEKKVFRAVAKTQLRTGLPIFTHNNYSTGPAVPAEMALYQLDELESAGGVPASIALGHVCCHYDPKADIAKRLAKRGAYVAFDRVTRQQQWVTDEQRIMMILAFLDAGYVDHLLISSDYIGRINTSTGEEDRYGTVLHARDGGPGYARPIKLFVPQLKKAGVSAKMLRKITHDNPLRFLSFVPKEA